MKRLISFFMCLLIVLNLTACGNQNAATAPTRTARPTATAVPPIRTAMPTASPTATAKVTTTTQGNKAKTEKAETTYIGNKKSKKFHRTDCRTLPAENNRVFLKSYEDAVKQGYSPCGNCNP